jgi:vancomycin resistance protein YoaR
MKNKFKRTILAFALILLFLLSIIIKPAYASDAIIRKDKKLPKNIYLNKVDIGGKTFSEIENLINDRVKQQEDREINITFTYGGKTQLHKFKLKDLGYITNAEDVKKQISLILYNDLNPIEKVKQYIDIRKKGRSYEITQDIEYNKFDICINKFDFSKLPKPVNAKHIYEDGQIKIISDVSGVEADRKKLFEELLESLNNAKRDFILFTKELKAQVTKEILKTQGIKEKISSFTTSFSASNIPRSSNIRLATKMIDGIIIPPGETFSFNKVVGPRTRAKGFQEAGIYINGNLDQGLGGGICQVSTTLYNAVLLADLDIIERDNHSLTVHYVPLSRDAAVNYGSKDLKFKNNTKYHLYIHAKCSESTVTFSLFSTRGNRRIELLSKTIGRIDSPIEYLDDPQLYSGYQYIQEKGRTGYESKLIRRIYENGKLVKEEIVSHDRYKPIPTVIKRGTKRLKISYYN